MGSCFDRWSGHLPLSLLMTSWAPRAPGTRLHDCYSKGMVPEDPPGFSLHPQLVPSLTYLPPIGCQNPEINLMDENYKYRIWSYIYLSLPMFWVKIWPMVWNEWHVSLCHHLQLFFTLLISLTSHESSLSFLSSLFLFFCCRVGILEDADPLFFIVCYANSGTLHLLPWF